MSGAVGNPADAPPAFDTMLGHPRPLWMLFMSEFWERFAFYGIRWALVLYIVAQFHGGDASGEAPASLTYGAYLALVYAGAIFGGYVADRILGYQRSILLGAIIMAAGLFMISLPNPTIFKLGLATIISATGCSSPTSRRWWASSTRRATRAAIGLHHLLHGHQHRRVLRADHHRLAGRAASSAPTRCPPTRSCSSPPAIGMLISMVWFWFGRASCRASGARPRSGGRISVLFVAVGAADRRARHLLPALGGRRERCSTCSLRCSWPSAR